MNKVKLTLAFLALILASGCSKNMIYLPLAEYTYQNEYVSKITQNSQKTLGVLPTKIRLSGNIATALTPFYEPRLQASLQKMKCKLDSQIMQIFAKKNLKVQKLASNYNLTYLDKKNLFTIIQPSIEINVDQKGRSILTDGFIANGNTRFKTNTKYSLIASEPVSKETIWQKNKTSKKQVFMGYNLACKSSICLDPSYDPEQINIAIKNATKNLDLILQNIYKEILIMTNREITPGVLQVLESTSKELKNNK